MFVYSVGIIDYFDGMLSIENYLKYTGDGYNDQFRVDDTKNFLLKCFLTAKMKGALEDRDITRILISAIPRCIPNVPYKLLAIKHNNNGSSYIISECPLWQDNAGESKVTELTDNEELEAGDIIRWVQESQLLVKKWIEPSKIIPIKSIEKPIMPIRSALKIDDFISSKNFDLDKFIKMT